MVTGEILIDGPRPRTVICNWLTCANEVYVKSRLHQGSTTTVGHPTPRCKEWVSSKQQNKREETYVHATIYYNTVFQLIYTLWPTLNSYPSHAKHSIVSNSDHWNVLVEPGNLILRHSQLYYYKKVGCCIFILAVLASLS